MTNTSIDTESLSSVTPEQLAAVTGGEGIGDFGGVIKQVGGMFGPEGSKWAGVAGSLFSALGPLAGK